nr:UDP-N-acetylglucosamine pyrophosphorylase [Ipomoea batatas]
MTPCLKVSPPKSCVVLEPVSEYHYKGNLKLHKLTPYPSALQFSSESQDSESSTIQSSEKLNVKYPELFGIKLGNQLVNRWKVADESPKWSPPKTCVLLEPPEDAAGECLIPETAPNPNQKNFLPKRISTQELGSKCELVESTPMMKEPESCIKIGKHPGENTLKRELWTKFEAASTHAICFNPPTTQKMALQKGFLDRLDEKLAFGSSAAPCSGILLNDAYVSLHAFVSHTLSSSATSSLPLSQLFQKEHLVSSLAWEEQETKDNTLVELGEQLAVAEVEEGTKNPAEAGVADTDETGVVVAAEHDSSAE